MGIDRESRMRIRAKDVFTYCSTLMIDLTQDQAKVFLRKFLEDSSEIYFLKSKFTYFSRNIEYIQQSFRKHMLGFTVRCEALGELWEKEKAVLTKECIAKKAKKK